MFRNETGFTPRAPTHPPTDEVNARNYARNVLDDRLTYPTCRYRPRWPAAAQRAGPNSDRATYRRLDLGHHHLALPLAASAVVPHYGGRLAPSWLRRHRFSP